MICVVLVTDEAPPNALPAAHSLDIPADWTALFDQLNRVGFHALTNLHPGQLEHRQFILPPHTCALLKTTPVQKDGSKFEVKEGT